MRKIGMRRQLPSLSALECFESSARHLSFTRAAKELHLTQSAVSRQIRTLEDLIGIQLFERKRQGLSLSVDCTAYLTEISSVLARLEMATLRLQANQGSVGMLNVAVLPTLGTRWLIPRLPSFRAKAPDITLNILTRLQVFDLEAENVDVAIAYGEAIWPNTVSFPLMGEVIAPVCSPDLLKSDPALKSPRGLASQTLLQLATRPSAWKTWFDGIGLNHAAASRGPTFEHFSMAVQAAIAGLGVAVVPLFLVSDELANGQLVMPFDLPVRSPYHYYMVCIDGRQDVFRIKQFRSWLTEQAKEFERGGGA
jgi:LysR family glycine cleavage system transcriptional activator